MMIFKMLRALPSARLSTAIFLLVPLKKDFRLNPKRKYFSSLKKGIKKNVFDYSNTFLMMVF
jgi:hypothetical protein